MRGKTVLITGGNSGIGFEAAKTLATQAGASVVICSRNMQRVSEAVARIDALLLEAKSKTSYDEATGELKPVAAGSIVGMQMDLASLDSVKSFAADFLKRFDRLDVLVHNAGIMFFPEEDNKAKKFRTADGFERYTQVNHLGAFLLTKLLWDLLVKTGDNNLDSQDEHHNADHAARVVLVSSCAQWSVGWEKGLDFSEEAWTRTTISGGATAELNRYGESKLMNVLFMRELARRIDAANAAAEKNTTKVNVIATAMHPGLSQTSLFAEAKGGLFTDAWQKTALMTSEKGSLGMVRCAAGEEIKNGSFYGPEFLLSGHPVDVSESKVQNHLKWAKNEQAMTTLWEKSEQAVLGEGEKFELST
eukprot:g17795.t1